MAKIGLWLGYLGMCLAVIGGAHWPDPKWALFALGVVIIGVGVGLRKKAGAPPIEATGSEAEKRSLKDVVAKVEADVKSLGERAPTLHLEAVKSEIEKIQAEGVERVAGAQEAIAARLGFPVYAEVMAPLATAERLLFRAWSAATDGHRPECLASLQQALPYASEAKALAETKFASI